MVGHRRSIAKPGRSLSAPQSDDEALAAYCPDLDQWPHSWMGEPRDLRPGRQIVECLKPFLLHLLGASLSPKTLRKHRDNLWLLGGELITDMNDDPALRRKPIAKLLLSVLHTDGGPLLSYRSSSDEQTAFDSTCRKLYRFLASHDPQTK
jgi:hypothetical protein